MGKKETGKTPDHTTQPLACDENGNVLTPRDGAVGVAIQIGLAIIGGEDAELLGLKPNPYFAARIVRSDKSLADCQRDIAQENIRAAAQPVQDFNRAQVQSAQPSQAAVQTNAVTPPKPPSGPGANK